MDPVRLRYKWNELPWKKIRRNVFKLQKRIYQAAKTGNYEKMRRLQKLLRSSLYAKVMAVRTVAQDNKGKRTPGVDGISSLTPKQRLNMAQQLSLTHKVQPVRRIWIPKPGNPTEKRPLGIPTMMTRASQTLVKLILEPEWEAKFEANSYGFRPKRSAHDAIQAIFKATNRAQKYVLDADIEKCFDRINHAKLLEKLNTSPGLSRTIKAWLKSGVMDGKECFPTKQGAPQGSPLSPLLTNIALHGLETKLKSLFPSAWKGTLTFVRYADDFVILHKDLDVIIQAKRIISQWLNPWGLQLKPSKTRITHTLHKFEGNVGFDFLGFHIRQYETGIYQSGKKVKTFPSSMFKLLIRPSKASIERYKKSLSSAIRSHAASSQEALIKQLNAKIRGWSNYFRFVPSGKTFNSIDNWLWLKLRNWGRRRHPHKTNRWAQRKYMPKKQLFGNKSTRLIWHTKITIKHFVKIQNTRSPFDGDEEYWDKRKRRQFACQAS